jgi:choice-of-anchor A domain-containing protein
VTRFFRLLTVLGLGVTTASAGPVYPGLGPAADYNVFVLGNFTESNSDAGGSGMGVAVGGNFNPSGGGSFTVHGDIVVGGSYTNGGASIGGSVYAYQDATFSNESILGGVYVGNNMSIGGGSAPGQGVYYVGTATVPSYYQYFHPNPMHAISASTFQNTYRPVDFSSAGASLKAESALLDTLATASGVTFSLSGSNHILTLSGSGQDFYDFRVDGSLFSSANTFVINVSGTNGQTPTVVVDVVNGDGPSSLKFPSLSPILNGLDPHYILYNFSGSSPLDTNHQGIMGSVLAPFSDVYFHGGNINGTMIAGNLSGSGESHAYRFLGTLPQPSPVPVPEPSSLVLVSTAVPALLAGLYFRRRMAAAIS